MKALLTMLLVFVLSTISWAKTLQGTLSGTLSRAGSPYHVTGDLIVETGTTLTIEPGVTLLFDSTVVLRVEGTLQAVASEALPITFKLFASNAKGAAWEGIQFTNRGSDDSRLQYCVIEQARRGVAVFSVSPTIENCQIRLCDQQGILLRVSRAQVVGNRISDNGAEGLRAVSFKGRIERNQIERNGADGLYLEKSPCTVVGNTIRANKDDGVFCLQSNAFLKHNRIEQNGDDAVLVGQCAPLLFNNTLVRSDFGLFAYRNSAPKVVNCTLAGNKYGVYIRENASAAIDNSILWDNETTVFTDSTSSVKISFSDVEGGFEGQGNFSAQPGFTETDYSALKADSPCNGPGNPQPLFFETGNGLENKVGARLK